MVLAVPDATMEFPSSWPSIDDDVEAEAVETEATSIASNVTRSVPSKYVLGEVATRRVMLQQLGIARQHERKTDAYNEQKF